MYNVILSPKSVLLTQNNVLKRINRTFRRLIVATVEKGFPILNRINLMHFNTLELCLATKKNYTSLQFWDHLMSGINYQMTFSIMFLEVAQILSDTSTKGSHILTLNIPKRFGHKIKNFLLFGF